MAVLGEARECVMCVHAVHSDSVLSALSQSCLVAVLGEAREKTAWEFLRKVHGQVSPVSLQLPLRCAVAMVTPLPLCTVGAGAELPRPL